MKGDITDAIDALRASRALPWLQVIADAALDREPDETTAASVVGPYHWLLRRIGDGVRLTTAGFLPPAVVLEAMTELGWQDRWIGKHNREDLTPPILELRESAQQLGLLRKYRGQLLVTKVGRGLVDDPTALWWHVAGRLPEGRSEPERVAGVLWLLTTAAGRPADMALLANGMSILGWVQRDGYGRLEPDDAYAAARATIDVFERLGPFRGGPGDRRQPAALGGRGRPGPGHTDRAGRAARAAPLASAPAVLRPRRTPQGAVQLTVSLCGVKPRIWRRLIVPASLTLRELHAVIQTAMGWDDYHLHLFEVKGVLYGDIEEIDGGPVGNEETFTVGWAAKPAGKFRYEYDFGDGWEHDVRVDKTLPSVGVGTPHLTGGARACPPEDCGGPWGYQDLLDVLEDPSHPEHAERLEWVGGEFDPEAFDLEDTNANLEVYDRETRQRRLHLP